MPGRSTRVSSSISCIEVDVLSCCFVQLVYRCVLLLLHTCSDYLFKLLLIGDSGVGKSCLLLRFAVSSGNGQFRIILWIAIEARGVLTLLYLGSDDDLCTERLLF